MRSREWERVVAALNVLGCETYHEDAFHVHLAYKATRWQAVPKRPLSVSFQHRIIRALEIDEHDYVAALNQTH